MNELPSLTFGDRLFAALQHTLPKHLMTRGIYAITRSRRRWVRDTFLRIFLNGYGDRIDMSEAVQPDPYAYATFNDFFTRALRVDARPIDLDKQVVVSPVDGTLSQAGDIRDDQLFQAKGHYYSLLELLGGDQEAAAAYRNGTFACIYLAPYNYHRIHMPHDGSVRSNLYVPGELFSVNASTARAVPRVFARNERLICDFDSPLGRMAVILVGALHVGSIQTVHCGEVNPPPRARKTPQRIEQGVGTQLAKGEELGRFNMGSTVVLLFQNSRVRWDDALKPESKVQLGRAIGRCV